MQELARFEKPLSSLTALCAPDRLAPDRIDATLDEIVKRDSRGRLFALEGLLRIYDGIHGKPFEGLLVLVKAAEDAIGAYTEKLEYLEAASKLGAPEPVLAALRATAAAEMARLRAFLPRLPSLLESVRSCLAATDGLDEEEDARAVVRELRRELEKNARLDWDLRDLEGGIHEMRRDLRWFLVYVPALDGLVVLEASRGPIKLNAYRYLETHPIAEGRFAKIEPNPALRWVTSIPRAYFLALSKVVNELGDVKSEGEGIEAVALAFRESGAAASPREAHARAVELFSRSPAFLGDLSRAARRIRKELDQTELLERLRKCLRANLREVRP